MAAASTTSAQTSSKRKGSKAVNKVPLEQSPTPVSEQSNGDHENTYIKELQKNIRNVNKKLAATQKVDSIVAENPNVSIDNLVATRKINVDQRTQFLKKPTLQAQLAQFEEQIIQFKKFEEDYVRRVSTEKEDIRVNHEQQLEAARAEGAQSLRHQFLVVSKFLMRAADRRQKGIDETTEESQAFEGVLLALYSGNDEAVDAMEKLVTGSEEKVTSTTGEVVDVSYERVKLLSLADDVDDHSTLETEAISTQALVNGHSSQDGATHTDPTIANAGLTEVNATGDVPPEVSAAVPDAIDQPDHIVVGDGAANAAGEGWDNKNSSSNDPMDNSWVSVPRDVTETENHVSGAAEGSTQNWADEVQESTPANDGFHEVHHGRGAKARGGPDSRGGRGRGGFRGEGRGRGGGYRGRGDGSRGRGRGRGRGESSVDR